MTPFERRQSLLDHMQELGAQGIHCGSCPGHCCTAVANSMQVTPLEHQDVLTYLKESGRWTEELRETLRATVRKFRLDQIPGNGRRQFLRRTYDCPFFAGGTHGCTLPREVKPYGCLGFNPTRAGETTGEGCTSDQGLLKRQAKAFPLEHDKLPLPLALLEWP